MDGACKFCDVDEHIIPGSDGRQAPQYLRMSCDQFESLAGDFFHIAFSQCLLDSTLADATRTDIDGEDLESQADGSHRRS
ncbi:hypothetical protein N579_09945 [Corynebacterium pseudodiphtheriticum 090104]|nr:hypothetical protein N579_09945 [Corynebacterium pseudodiphtheriticum 090104]